MSAVALEYQTWEVRTHRPWRLAELWLLLLSVGAGLGAIALVGLGLDGELSDRFWTEAVWLAALALVAHVVVRFAAPYADQAILPTVFFLNGIGVAMIMRIEASPARAAANADAVRQMQWSILGVVMACLVLWLLRDHRLLRKFTYTSMFIGLGLIALPLAPGIGRTINGATRWIVIGGLSMQPAEFAKIFLAIFFAGYLVTARDSLALAGPKVLGIQLPRMRDLGPILVVWAASIAVLVFQTDLGVSLLFFGMFVAMLYMATDRISWMIIGGLMFVGGAAALWVSFPHVAQRMDGWLNAMDPAVIEAPGGSWQIVQGLFGMAEGGMLGSGLGRGNPYIVPFSFSDFIFASLGEELGLIGVMAILVAFLVLCERGLRTALLVRDGFGKLLAGGFAFVLALQVFVVVGGITRVIPMTGLALPFMAQGGSAVLANWIIVAVLLRISDDARRPSLAPERGQVAIAPTPEEVVAGQMPTQAVAPLEGVEPVFDAQAGGDEK
ncbi:MAG: FtsW/RodA/SpoVE family cell cycle protein [Promicromonosporaceae bacterium]|nr:FtsW/RodA/SpoVE family cell cycle protein [Promicromonosporaceae bacterium]